jgi:hypothetical protein
VAIQVDAVIHQGGALQAGGARSRIHSSPAAGNGDALAVGGVDAGGDIDRDLAVERIGVVPAGKGLDVAAAALVAVVNDPRRLGLALGRPAPLAHRHCIVPNYSQLWRTIVNEIMQQGRDI